MNQTQRLQRFFSPLLISFIVAVVILVIAVCYVAFSKTTIAIKLSDVPANVPFQYSATELDIEPITVPMDTTYTFTDYEADSSEDAVARGTVTLINNYSGDQRLVQTTRLLSDDGVLFRTDEDTVVPAGGSVEVAVYADQPGASGNIAPSRFEIVNLNSSLKDNIYGESSSAMTGGVIKKVTLTDELVAEAKEAAEDEAVALAQASAADAPEADVLVAASNNWHSNITEQTVDGTVGDEVDTITVRTKGSVTYVPIDEEIIREQLVADDQPISDGTITYTVTTDGTDWIISGEAQTDATEPSLDFLDVAVLTGKTEQQIKEYLADFEQIDSVTVKFVPFWIDRTPKLPQQIHLTISK